KLSKFKTWLEQIPEALGDSIEGVEAVSKIVAAMKEFSHPGSDQKCHVSMNQVLDSTITVAKNEWKYVADIETDYEEDLNLIDGLRAELNQAFLNIVMNAAHAIGDRVEAGDYSKGKIKLTTRSAEDGIEVSIQDNGGGIPESARDRVFDPFFTTKAVGKGTGQGLSIAYSVIAKQHGGQLRFEVEEGVGTTFLIKIPTIC
ncbi:MAG: two-component system NtrC family sensor kinase, partial [Mariniblastus sp.]